MSGSGAFELRPPPALRSTPARLPSHELGATLHAARKRAGLCQLDLAIRMGMSPKQIRRVEQGRCRPTAYVLDTWLRVCGVRLELKLVDLAPNRVTA